jgi:hypothetical protein
MAITMAGNAVIVRTWFEACSRWRPAAVAAAPNNGPKQRPEQMIQLSRWLSKCLTPCTVGSVQAAEFKDHSSMA